MEQRFVDRNGMAPFVVMLGPSKYVYVHTYTPDSHPRIPNPEDDKFHEYGVSEMEELWKAWCEDVVLRALVKFNLLF